MQINSAMIVIFAIILTQLAVISVNTHVLQDLNSLLTMSDATFLLIYLFFFESSCFIFFQLGKNILIHNFLRTP